jgi:DNA modification methylase
VSLSPEIFLDGKAVLWAGDARHCIAHVSSDLIDAVVCDPPYGISFMGRDWDRSDTTAFDPEFWRQVLRVLKPGGHLVAFGGTRSYHRLACAIEDAGFEIRDCLQWLYGSGFPKSHDVSKGIDRAAGAAREVVGFDAEKAKRFESALQGQNGGWDRPWMHEPDAAFKKGNITAPATDSAREWSGWGTALKPSQEPIVMGRKPLEATTFFAILLRQVSEGLFQWLDLSASDVEKSFSRLLATLHAAESSVLAPARMSALASIDPASFVAPGSISISLGSSEQTRTRVDIAQLLARPWSSAGPTPDRLTGSGEADDIPTLIMGMCTSVAMGDTSQNIVSSWLSISDAILREASKFTIGTASRLTTALRTLNCLLLPSIGAATGSFAPNASPIVLARKPLSESTIAANVLRWGTGALNVDGCRVDYSSESDRESLNAISSFNGRHKYEAKHAMCDGDREHSATVTQFSGPNTKGRWPANVLHDGSDEVVGAFPETHGAGSAREGSSDPRPTNWSGNVPNAPPTNTGQMFRIGDSGSAARFFYTAKADADDRLGFTHPTIKPVDLMQWLVRLVTPKGGLVLDPFAGTGTTGEAAFREGMRAMLFEREPEYQGFIRERMRLCLAGPDERRVATIKRKPEPPKDGLLAMMEDA